MTDINTLDPLHILVVDSLKASDAPRFLQTLFTLPPGEHRITVDVEDVQGDAEIWLNVAGTGEARRISLSYPHDTYPTVWTHIVVSGGDFREAKTLEESLPPAFDVVFPLTAFAAGSMAIEDMCDACAFPRDPANIGQDAPRPLESVAPFDGRL